MYDYIIEKHELNEETLSHYGIKGMKWKKRKNRKKSKKEKEIERNRAGNHIYSEDITTNNGNTLLKRGTMTGIEAWARLNTYGKEATEAEAYRRRKLYGGTSNSLTGQDGSNIERGIAAGRERVKKKKK